MRMIIIAATTNAVMAGLVPAIHDFASGTKEDVDARDEPGHDDDDRVAS
jgi:hypothetical protein